MNNTIYLDSRGLKQEVVTMDKKRGIDRGEANDFSGGGLGFAKI